MGKKLSMFEFIVLMAFMFSLIAYATDAMLPAFEQIAEDLQTANVSRVQLIIATFFMGTGIGQLLAGPLSDTLGRKPVILGGIGIFVAASIWAWLTSSIEMLLVARFVQGLGISAPRTVGMAMVRDQYSGRQMARVVSFAMMLFVLVPGVAPLFGQFLMINFGWRSIFLSCVVLGALVSLWLWTRQEETLGVEKRKSFRWRVLIDGWYEMRKSKRAMMSMFVLCFAYSLIFAYISSAQQVFVDWLGAGEAFPLYFGVIAVLSGFAGALNAVLVVRLGMWLLSTVGMLIVFICSMGVGGAIWGGLVPEQMLLSVFVGWSIMMFFVSGLVFTNLNAMAMEPMGHIAGTASALIGAISTIGSMVLVIPIGQMYNGTGLPLIFVVGFCAGMGFLLNQWNPREADG
ncbi:MAG: multidrug effflux MFS transporter [Amylibacter sp.]|nr:multidrug effflux MFS transporter [Amylibacter sp.]